MHNIYVTIAGDTWDIVAFKTLGNEMYRNAILEQNEACREIVIFPAGVTLIIPVVKSEVSEKLPPWKRGIAVE